MTLDMTKPRIMIIDPPTGIYYRDDRCQARSADIVTVAVRPQINLAYLATIFEKGGAECFVKDYSLISPFGEWSEFKKDVKNFQPNLVLFNVTSPSVQYDVLTAKITKAISKDTIVIGRGIHFNLFDEQILRENPDLDAVVRGEFEETLEEFIGKRTFESVRGITYRKGSQIIRNDDRPFIDDMDRIPIPDRKWLENKKFLRADTGEPETTIRTSKGCPHSCIFCLAQCVSGKKIRQRSPKLIVDEIQGCLESYGIKNYLFRSDLFTFNRDWLYEICDEIRARNLKIAWACNSRVDTLDEEKLKRMKASGCWAVGMGVESGNEESLKKMKKGITLAQSKDAVRLCRRAGVKAFTYFLIGFPWEARGHIEDTIRFAVMLNGDLAQFSPLYPFPGTELYKVGLEDKLFTDQDLHPYSLIKPVCGTHYLSAFEVEDYLSKAFKTFHLRPQYILRTLACAGSLKQSLNYMHYGMKALFKLKKHKQIQTV